MGELDNLVQSFYALSFCICIGVDYNDMRTTRCIRVPGEYRHEHPPQPRRRTVLRSEEQRLLTGTVNLRPRQAGSATLSPRRSLTFVAASLWVSLLLYLPRPASTLRTSQPAFTCRGPQRRLSTFLRLRLFNWVRYDAVYVRGENSAFLCSEGAGRCRLSRFRIVGFKPKHPNHTRE